MDPNANLVELRTLANGLQDADWLNGDDPPQDAYRAARMAELFMALDNWIAKGGFLPQAWLANRTASSTLHQPRVS